MNKKMKVCIIILTLLMILYVYVLAIGRISERYVIFEGENLPLKTIWGLNIQNENQTIETVANTGKNTIETVRYNNFKT